MKNILLESKTCPHDSLKKNFFILFFSSIVIIASAQNDYKKMLDVSRLWTYYEESLVVSLEGPVEVSGKNCYQIYARIANESVSSPTGMYIYEESKCVYVYNYYDYDSYPNQWIKRFDFNLKEGEDGVKSIDYISIDGVSFRCLNFGEYSWIEGVGDSRFGIMPIKFFYSMPTFGNSSDLGYDFSIYEDGQLTFTNEKFMSAITRIIPSYEETDSGFLYDLQGRRLSSVPRKGVYVRNGKKYVVK